MKKSKYKINIFCYILLSILLHNQLQSQVFAPPAGFAGTTAMYKDSSAFVNWVSTCKVIRGLQDISNTSLGFANVGDSSAVLGTPLSNGVVSLGDGGIAICQFQFPINDGDGPDFAVFENSFDGLFLELAFVEVSSDGVNYFRIPCHSLIDTSKQVASFDSTDATHIHNFAGKYQAGYGTPFDLNDIPNHALLNKSKVSHVKIIDVVGSINNLYATRDSYNNKVNEPWPTPFGSSGFDLDAIGVIHQNSIIGLNEVQMLEESTTVFPNPIKNNQTLKVHSIEPIVSVQVYNLLGEKCNATNHSEINVMNQTPGFYFLKIEFKNTFIIKKIEVY